MESRRATLNQRAIDRLVQHPEFPGIWQSADLTQRNCFIELFQDRSLQEIKQWIKTVRRRSLGDKSARELIELCRYYHVPNYSRMEKKEMIAALLDHGINDKQEKHV